MELVFPNIELRFALGTARGKAINVHLLVSPEDSEHVEHAQRLLSQLTFVAYDDTFGCEPRDLMRLGRAHNPAAGSDVEALRIGTEQFKVDPRQIREFHNDSSWMRDNVLIAIAASGTDGTSGLQQDSSMAVLRGELERLSNIVFSGQPNDREFWLGRGKTSIEELHRRRGGPKPCLHGSDAHRLDRVGRPDADRRCWLKGDVTFETLRQAVIEPEERIFIGEGPPIVAKRSYVIDQVSLVDAPWATVPTIPLNSGLIAIIGARGSGKTALADVVAAGAQAMGGHISPRSFLARAGRLLGGSTAVVRWEDQDETRASLERTIHGDRDEWPRVQYLSQQFVETLCSAEGMTDELLEEVERVVFEAHPPEDRLGATDFQALLSLRAMRSRSKRARHQESLAQATAELTTEREWLDRGPTLQRQRRDLVTTIGRDKADRAGLIKPGSQDRANAYNSLTAVAETIRGQVNARKRQHGALLALQDAIADARTRRASSDLAQLRADYRDAALTEDQWQAFRMDYKADVDALLRQTVGEVMLTVRRLEGQPPDPMPDPVPETSYLPENTDPATLPLRLLDKEISRLRALIGIDTARAQALRRLSEKIAREEAALAALDADLLKANGARERIGQIGAERNHDYEVVFEALIEEQAELEALYAPMRSRLEGEAGALGKLSFAVRRSADVGAWASRGEELLDLRKVGPFKGRGSLEHIAESRLTVAWETGDAAEVADAMRLFVEEYGVRMFDQAPVDRPRTSGGSLTPPEQSQLEEFRGWQSTMSAWLYSTDHLRISYDVQYDGVAIEQLSPGTRGIVLLLLYLALDHNDDRPLIIDQPEENLDPKSVNDELVERFRRGRRRRQIVIVTHNANLVVNTDVDQVIVAASGPHISGRLPDISYMSGGLENPDIRKEVCEILEGGEAAFRERARRLRLRLT